MRGCPLVASWVVTCVALVPSSAEAQRQLFIQGLSELTTSLAGTYGDEGARVERALETMARGLDEWDQEIRAAEARRASPEPGAAATLEAGVALAQAYAARGRYADAVRELDEARRLGSLEPGARLLEGLLLEAIGRPDDAGRVLLAAWAAERSDPVTAYHALRLGAGDGSARGGPLETLAAAYRRLIEVGPGSTAIRFARIGLLPDVATYPRILPPAAYAGGYALLAQHEYARAIVELRAAAWADPLVEEARAGRGAVPRAAAAIRQGRLAEARALLEAPSTEETSSEARRLLGLIHGASAEYDASVEQLERAIAERPQDERSRLTLARVLGSAGREAEAERALRQTLDVLPRSALARWWLGQHYERLNRFADARREYERAAEDAAAAEAGLSMEIGRLATGALDLPVAGQALARAVAVHPDDATAHKALAGVRLREGRADEAFAELVAVALLDPSDAAAHAAVGRLDLNAGRYEDAVAALRHALELSPSQVEARYELATALRHLGRTAEADRELARFEDARRGAQEDRRRRLVLDVLKEEAALRTSEGAHARSAELWRQVVEREPDAASSRLALAAALVASGRPGQAVEQYEAALALGTDPDVYRRLAELYGALGRREDASRAGLMYFRALQGQATAAGPPP